MAIADEKDEDRPDERSSDGIGGDAIVIDSPVLCVDLDGTLIRTDVLHESLLLAVKARPEILLRLPFWFASGRRALSQRLTSTLEGSNPLAFSPIQAEVAALVSAARRAGKEIVLLSDHDPEPIAHHFEPPGMFDEVIGVPDDIDQPTDAKAAMLSSRYPSGFAYVGNDRADLPIWRAARERFAVNLPDSVRQRGEEEGLGIVELAQSKGILRSLTRAMRLHQWLKNVLLFVPMSLIISKIGWRDLAMFIAGFLLLGLLTSGTYLINDLLDLQADRQHPRKRRRPIASGDLPIMPAALGGFLCILVALVGAFALRMQFGMVLLSYLVLTLAYSLRLKQVALLDVFIIATLFTVRILAGAILVGQPLSDWLLIFSVFFFLSLALMKREVELNVLSRERASESHKRSYAGADRTFVTSFGIASGTASLVIFALFISLPGTSTTNYASPTLLWGAMAVLGYWLAHMWLLTTRGEMDDDPILYAARDRVSICLGVLTLAFAVAAQFPAIP